MHYIGLFKVLCTTLSVIRLRLAFDLLWTMKHVVISVKGFLILNKET